MSFEIKSREGLIYPEDESGTFLRNSGNYLPHYMETHPKDITF
jgi:hypothetical protein